MGFVVMEFTALYTGWMSLKSIGQGVKKNKPELLASSRSSPSTGRISSSENLNSVPMAFHMIV